jgi:hypothetical protein
MNLSKTDTKELLRTLQDASMIISSLSSNIKEANVARKCRLLRKKIIKCSSKEK